MRRSLPRQWKQRQSTMETWAQNQTYCALKEHRWCHLLSYPVQSHNWTRIWDCGQLQKVNAFWPHSWCRNIKCFAWHHCSYKQFWFLIQCLPNISCALQLQETLVLVWDPKKTLNTTLRWKVLGLHSSRLEEPHLSSYNSRDTPT